MLSVSAFKAATSLSVIAPAAIAASKPSETLVTLDKTSPSVALSEASTDVIIGAIDILTIMGWAIIQTARIAIDGTIAPIAVFQP